MSSAISSIRLRGVPKEAEIPRPSKRITSRPSANPSVITGSQWSMPPRKCRMKNNFFAKRSVAHGTAMPRSLPSTSDFAQRLGAVDDEQAADLRVEPALDQIVDQRLD